MLDSYQISLKRVVYVRYDWREDKHYKKNKYVGIRALLY